jgi:hypothetical protein
MSRAFALALALVVAGVAAAGEVKPQKSVPFDDTMSADHGLLLLVTDGNQGIKRIQFSAEEGAAVFNTASAPGELQLSTYRVKAGKYRIDEIEMMGGRVQRLKPEDPATPRFEVVAGAYNYFGDVYVKMRADGVKARFTGNNLDLLTTLARIASPRAFTKGDELGPFATRPFVVSGPLRATLAPALGAPPQESWKLADWLAASGLPTRDEQLEACNKILAKAELKPLTVGMTRKEVATVFEKFTDSDGKHYAAQRGPELVWLYGLFGFEGLALMARLDYGDGDKLERVHLRTIDGWAVISAPRGALWQDVKGYADAAAP